VSSNLSLFEPPRTRYSRPDPDDVCLGRHLGNDESDRANRIIHGSKEQTRLRILELVKASGDRGMTCSEIAAALGKEMHAISGRLSEMKIDGRLVATDRTRKTPTGTPARVLVAR